MKKLLALFFLISLSWQAVYSWPPQADATIDDVRYVLDQNTKTATVTCWLWDGTGCNKYNNVKVANIPDTIEYESEKYRVVGIEEYAFYNCKQLTKVTIPESVTSIGSMAFYGCPLLTTVLISDSVPEIGEAAFGNCTALQSIRLPYNLTKIPIEMFTGCTGLMSITIPQNVTEIEEMAFHNCSSLTSVMWNARDCKAYDFGSQVDMFHFGADVEVIPSHLCEGISADINGIPGNVRIIGDSAFYNSHLSTLVSGGDNVLDYSSLDYSNLDSIGTGAFANNPDLMIVMCAAAVPPRMGEHVFDSATYSQAELYVPFKSKKAYKAAEHWKDFLHIQSIVEPDEYTITFQNWNDSVLQILQVPRDEMPVYTGETPTRPDDDEWTYVFDGWDPQITKADDDATYVAVYLSSPKEQALEDIHTESTMPVKILHEGHIYILRGKNIYTATGVQIK